MKGSCLCGAIEYEVDQLDMPISHCLATLVAKLMQRLLRRMLVLYGSISAGLKVMKN